MEQDTITYSAVISTCEEAGAVCQSDVLYAEAYADGLLDHQLDSFPTDMDLHDLCPASLGRRCASSLPFCGGRPYPPSTRDLNIFTGFSFFLTPQPSSLYAIFPSHRVVL